MIKPIKLSKKSQIDAVFSTIPTLFILLVIFVILGLFSFSLSPKRILENNENLRIDEKISNEEFNSIAVYKTKINFDINNEKYEVTLADLLLMNALTNSDLGYYGEDKATISTLASENLDKTLSNIATSYLFTWKIISSDTQEIVNTGEIKKGEVRAKESDLNYIMPINKKYYAAFYLDT